jgi:hypothetical protein
MEIQEQYSSERGMRVVCGHKGSVDSSSLAKASHHEGNARAQASMSWCFLTDRIEQGFLGQRNNLHDGLAIKCMSQAA